MFSCISPNVRVYEPLRDQGALLSSYHKVTKRADLRKPTASNGLYTLLAVVFYLCVNFELSTLDFIPMIISMADMENIIGQSLKGRNFTLKPVNKDNTANENSIPTIKM